VIHKHRESKARCIRYFNHGQLPFFLAVFHKQNPAQKICQIKQCAAVRTHHNEVQEKHEASHSLHKKEQAVFLALE
jgi:hypothetical protein